MVAFSLCLGASYISCTTMQHFSRPQIRCNRGGVCCRGMWLHMIEKALCKTAHLEKAQIPDVAPCLHRMRERSGQLPDVSKAKIDPLPSQRVHHMGRVPDQGQPGPHISAGLARISPHFCRSLQSIFLALCAGNSGVWRLTERCITFQSPAAPAERTAVTRPLLQGTPWEGG